MNVCFKYGLMNSLDTNREDAAYHWAIYDTQVKYKRIPNPNNPKTTMLVKDDEADKKIIYIYESGRKVLTQGGMYDLICRINSNVRKTAQGAGEQIKLIYPSNSETIGIVDSSGENQIPTTPVGDNKPGLTKPTNTEIEMRYDYVTSNLVETAKQSATPKVTTEVNRDLNERSVPAKATKDMKLPEVIADEIARGARLDVDNLPITMEVYGKTIEYLKAKTFKENYDPNSIDTGDNYDIGKYVISLLFSEGKSTYGKSWIESQIHSITDGYHITKEGVILTTNLTVPDKEDEGKEIVDNNVEEALRRGKIDYQDIVESRDSFKEIFCSLAIVSTLRKSTLWELISYRFCKVQFTPNSTKNFLDYRMLETIERLPDKLKYKDCTSSRDNNPHLNTIGSDKSWEYHVIKKAFKWLCLPHHNLDLHLIREDFLQRTDLIRACNTEEEFLEMIKYDSGVDFSSPTILTREKLICQRLDLATNVKYVKLRDIEELSVCEISKLIPKLEHINSKINDAYAEVARCEDEIKSCQTAMAELRENIKLKLYRGAEIDLTKREYYLSDLSHSIYSGHLKKSTESGSHRIYVFIRVTSDGIVVLDRHTHPAKEFEGVTLQTLNTYAEAKIQPVGVMDDAEEARNREALLNLDRRVQECQKDIARLKGEENIYGIRNVARPSSEVECEARILNSWVEILLTKFKARQSRYREFAKLHRRGAKFTSLEDTKRNTSAGQIRMDIEGFARNANYNIQAITEQCQSSFANDNAGFRTESVHCNRWFVANSASENSTCQEINIHRATCDGGKSNHGSTETVALVHKDGVYVIALDDIHMIIPIWYGCQTQNEQLKSEYYKPKNKFYADNLNDVFLMVSSFYRENKDNLEIIEDFSEKTGIFFLTPDEAFECIEELNEFRDSILLKTETDKSTGKQVRVYHSVFLSLTALAGVKPDIPKETARLQKEGKIKI